MDKYSVLKNYFGHESFRSGQEHLIDAILSGRDVLGIMPTGGGKSICYQVPALLLPGVTLVVSPLISLMKDQVSALNAAGVDAAYVNSSLGLEQLRTVYSRVRSGAYKLVYVAPERFDAEGFAALSRSLHISLIAVDEAHCISQWGQDFRPSYLRIADFINSLPTRPVVAAFTATATGPVQQDIVRLLGLDKPVLEVTGFDRPNLFFDVQQPKDKLAAVSALVKARKDKTGIIYCATRSGVERVCKALCSRGVAATRYHAGLSDAERHKNQDDFQFDRKNVMVATNAFGMGIDKSNVGYVIHYNMPKSLEAYYQEAGRAGRDGEPADCILLYSVGDIVTAKFLIENNENETLSDAERDAVRKRDYQRLQVMIDYCRTTACLRGLILDYFGQQHEATCGNCGNCRGEYQQEDITIPAQMILSCVLRVHEHLGYYVGKTLIMQVLRGSEDKRIAELRLGTLSTYGLMRNLSADKVRACIDLLERDGYLRTEPAHSTLQPTEAAQEVLFRGQPVYMNLRTDRVTEPPREKRKKKSATVSADESGLLPILKRTRTRLAQEANVPAYIIFSNATLSDMAGKAPHSVDEFLEVSGVGQVKAAKYAKDFLAAIAEYEKESES